MPASVKATFEGPTPAQLAQTGDKNFQDTMIGMAQLFGALTNQQRTSALEKQKADLAAQQENSKNALGVLDAATKATVSGSINELASTPAGQAVIASTYKTLGYSDDMIKSLIGMYASNPYSADQIHAQVAARGVADMQGAAGEGQAAQTAPPAPPAPAAQQSSPGGAAAGPVAAPPSATVAAPPSFPAESPLAMGAAAAPAPAPAVAAPTAAPAPAPAPATPQATAQAKVASAQANAQAVTATRQEARNMDPQSARSFLQQSMAPDSLYLALKAMEKDPNKFMEDTNPDVVAKQKADVQVTLATAQKLGLENDKAIKDLANYDETFTTDINYKKALTLQALKNAAAAAINAKLSSVAFQTNNAVFSKVTADAAAQVNDFRNSVSAAEKAGKITGNDISSWNSMISRINDTYDQANQLAANMAKMSGEPAGNVAVFRHIGLVDQGQLGALQSAKKSIMEFLFGSGTGAAVPVFGTGGPQAGATGQGGTAAPSSATTVTTTSSPVPNGMSPAEQAAADKILKDLGLQ